MNSQNFKNKKVAIIGLGLEGLSSLEYFKKHEAIVTVFDKKERSLIDQETIRRVEELADASVFGPDYLIDLSQFDLIIRSPGIKLRDLESKVNRDKISSQTKLFFDFCPCKIVGVTGTKGKGTTATIIYEILKKEGKDAYLIGNIGKAPFDILDKLDTHSIVVFELSSFQLMDLHKGPNIAVLLMVTSEHLNYHKNLEEYVDAKRNLLRYQTSEDYSVLNRDYPASLESDVHTDAKILQISRGGSIPGDGCFIEKDDLVCRLEGKEERIMDIGEILLPGVHNLENVAAATVVAKLLKVKNKNIVSVLQTFKGLEHRLELAGIVDGVFYYDDSISTIPETAIAAIEAFDEPEILILGGSSKKSDFSELAKVIKGNKNIKAIIGIGEEWKLIKSYFSNVSIPLIEGAKNMETVVKAASKIAECGDIVLLSPACASFDMFKSYKDRGDQFKEEVKKLGKETN